MMQERQIGHTEQYSYKIFTPVGEMLREARGMRSARSVAKEAGISTVYLLALEQGANRKTGKPSIPSTNILLRLANVLNIKDERLLSTVGFAREMSSIHSGGITPEKATIYANTSVTIFQRLAFQEREGAANMMHQEGFNPDNLPIPFIYRLKLGSAYSEAAKGIQQVLTVLNQRIQAISSSNHMIELSTQDSPPSTPTLTSE